MHRLQLFNIVLMPLVMIASETTLLEVDFSKVSDLSGWTDVHQKNPPNPNNYYIKEGALTTAPTEYFGLSHALVKPITISKESGKIVVECTFMQPSEARGHTLGFALTSRKTTCPYNGRAFWPGKEDSGFQVSGYSYGIQFANSLMYLRGGLQTTTYAPRPPFSFLPGTDRLVTWRLVFNAAEESILFYPSADAEKPQAELHRVNLDGEVLNSLWISSFGVKYFKIKVLQIKE